MIAIIQGYAEVAKVLLKQVRYYLVPLIEVWLYRNQAETHHVDENGNNVFHIATKSLNTRLIILPLL